MTTSTDTDNRDKDEIIATLEAERDALRKRIAELEVQVKRDPS